MLNYIYDFLSIIFDKLKDKERIKSIILFGSTARGTQRKDSDIDLFIDCKKSEEQEIRLIVQESLNEFELKASKSWNLKGIKYPIIPIIGDIEETRWSELHKEISNTGIILYGTYLAKSINRKHHVLITYNLTKCSQKKKMKILRNFYGYANKKGKKKYVKSGLVTSLNGEKIQNSIMIDISSHKKILEEIKKNKIPYTIRDLWI